MIVAKYPADLFGYFEIPINANSELEARFILMEMINSSDIVYPLIGLGLKRINGIYFSPDVSVYDFTFEEL